MKKNTVRKTNLANNELYFLIETNGRLRDKEEFINGVRIELFKRIRNTELMQVSKGDVLCKKTEYSTKYTYLIFKVSNRFINKASDKQIKELSHIMTDIVNPMNLLVRTKHKER